MAPIDRVVFRNDELLPSSRSKRGLDARVPLHASWNMTGPMISLPRARLFKIIAHTARRRARQRCLQIVPHLLLMDHV